MTHLYYKLINYVFSIAVYDLPPVDHFVDAVLLKIPGPGIKEFVEPVFKVFFIVKGNAPHVVQQRAEKIVSVGARSGEYVGC